MFGLSLDQGAVRLLRRAVAPFIQMPCFYGKMYISPDDLTFIAASTPNPIAHNPSVVTALRLRPSFFNNFICDESLCLVIDLNYLYHILCQARDDDYLGIYGNGTHDRVSIVLLGAATRDFRDANMDVVSIHHGQMNVPQLQYEYQVIVGIPSMLFRTSIVELHQFGVTVFAEVTDTQVTFSVGNERVVLSKELEQCIIGGAVSEDPVSLVFSLWHVQAMVHASAVSDRVWLLGQSNGLHVMLNCPVGENGNRMFYFG
ncbi:unnamed protein product [Prunus armeniaca]|uniref:Proliferating cell nuclear antigen PCNA N-terminal domain-containing protein n=1 Tax=Prunus armeniaca TaxID=36596 RepID=A0A6J5WEZ0_PRUAR|nr:unnamed protein product [Prunus armeniaca]